MDFSLGSSSPPLLHTDDVISLFLSHYASLLSPSYDLSSSSSSFSSSSSSSGIDVQQLSSERDLNFLITIKKSHSTPNQEEKGHPNQYIFKCLNEAEPLTHTDLQTQALLHLQMTLSSSFNFIIPLSTPIPIACSSDSPYAGLYYFPYKSPHDGRVTTIRLLSFVPGCPLRHHLTSISSSSSSSPSSSSFSSPSLKVLSPKLLHSMGEALASIDISLRGFTHSQMNRILYWDICQSHHLHPLLQHIHDDVILLLPNDHIIWIEIIENGLMT